MVAGQHLNVQNADNGTSAAVTAVGNSATASGSNAPLDFESTQTLSGTVSALNQPSVAGSSGPYMVTTTSATGNSATASTCCATTSGNSTQAITGPAVGAESDVYLGGYALDCLRRHHRRRQHPGLDDVQRGGRGYIDPIQSRRHERRDIGQRRVGGRGQL